MTAYSISDVVEQAMAFTGMQQLPVEDRTKSLRDHGPWYLGLVFEEDLPLKACFAGSSDFTNRLILFRQKLYPKLTDAMRGTQFLVALFRSGRAQVSEILIFQETVQGVRERSHTLFTY